MCSQPRCLCGFFSAHAPDVRRVSGRTTDVRGQEVPLQSVKFVGVVGERPGPAANDEVEEMGGDEFFREQGEHHQGSLRHHGQLDHHLVLTCSLLDVGVETCGPLPDVCHKMEEAARDGLARFKLTHSLDEGELEVDHDLNSPLKTVILLSPASCSIRLSRRS